MKRIAPPCLTIYRHWFQFDKSTRRFKTITKFVTPLFDLTIFQSKPKMFKIARYNLPSGSYRILIISNSHLSVARKKALQKYYRSEITDLVKLTKYKDCIFSIGLRSVASLLPRREVLQQLIGSFRNELISLNQLPELQMIIKHYHQMAQLPSQHFPENYNYKVLRRVFKDNEICDALFPFHYLKWRKVVAKRFQNNMGLSNRQLSQSYQMIELDFMLVAGCSKNLIGFCRDIIDFTSFLAKFDIIGFFVYCHDNVYLAQARNIAFLRLLEWRTSQTQEFFIHIVREQNIDTFKIKVITFNNLAREILKSVS